MTQTPPQTPPASRVDRVVDAVLRPNLWVVAAAWVYVVAHFAGDWASVGAVYRDTDDMMRLAEVRDLLAGQGWFDLHQYRLDPPAEVPMHWSRLVDLPIALLVRLFETLLPIALAEKAAMILWPALTLVPGLLGIRALAIRLGGPWASLPALYLFATLPQSIGQFVPGRIDHHNIQISATLVLLALLAAPPSPRRAVAAGLLGAAMLAIGLETLPFQVIATLAFATRYVTSGSVTNAAARDETAIWAASFGLGTLAVAAATLPLGEGLRGACDALSANWLALALVGGLGLAALSRLPLPTRTARAVAVLVLAVAAVTAFAAPAPRCLAGPFAEVTPAVRALWLDHVTEVEPFGRFFADHSAAAVLALVMPLLGLLAALSLARDAAMRRRPGFWGTVAAAIVTWAIGLLQLRTLTYANALAVPLVAAVIGRIAQAEVRAGRRAVTAVLGGILLANSILPAVLLDRLAPAAWKEQEAVGRTVTAGARPQATDAAATTGAPCFTLADWDGLARLPAGLVAAEIDLGPVILITSAHSVVAAPYHRMQRGMIDVDAMLSRPPVEALAAMRARGVDYLVACTASKTGMVPGGLMAEALAGRAPADLVEVAGSGPIRIFRRVDPAPALTGH